MVDIAQQTFHNITMHTMSKIYPNITDRGTNFLMKGLFSMKSYLIHALPYDDNDKIHIPIQKHNVFTLPVESVLYTEGRLTEDDAASTLNVKLVIMRWCFFVQGFSTN